MIFRLKVFGAKMTTAKYAISIYSNGGLTAVFDITGPHTHGDELVNGCENVSGWQVINLGGLFSGGVLRQGGCAVRYICGEAQTKLLQIVKLISNPL